MYTVVEHLLPEVASTAAVWSNDLCPSQSTNHMLFPVADNIHGSICLHVPLIYKKNNIDWLVLTPFSTYSYTPRAGAHKLDICDTMVCCRNLMDLALPRLDNFINWGSCPWCAHQHDTEYTKDHRDPPSPSWCLVTGLLDLLATPGFGSCQ